MSIDTITANLNTVAILQRSKILRFIHSKACVSSKLLSP